MVLAVIGKYLNKLDVAENIEEYRFEDGMTWAEWINSSYNNDNIVVKAPNTLSYDYINIYLFIIFSLLFLGWKIVKKEY